MKKTYKAPQIELIKLDNEISLALASDTPPVGPDEGAFNAPQQFNSEPFRDNLV